MQKIASAAQRVIIVFVLVGLIFVFGNNYSAIMSKVVKGDIVAIERVTQADMVIGRSLPSEQLYSYAVAVRASDGEIFTASSEDRQWAVAKTGYCVEARFYPYPPWDFEKSGTYHNARLLKLVDCKVSGKTEAGPGAQGEVNAPPATAAPPSGVTPSVTNPAGTGSTTSPSATSPSADAPAAIQPSEAAPAR